MHTRLGDMMKGLYDKPTQSQAAIQIAAWHKLHQDTSKIRRANGF